MSQNTAQSRRGNRTPPIHPEAAHALAVATDRCIGAAIASDEYRYPDPIEHPAAIDLHTRMGLTDRDTVRGGPWAQFRGEFEGGDMAISDNYGPVILIRRDMALRFGSCCWLVMPVIARPNTLGGKVATSVKELVGVSRDEFERRVREVARD